MPENIGSILSSIPASIWSSIVTGTVAFVGVFLANRDNTKRLMRQLEHDTKEKARERTALLRREVYLKAVEELVNLQCGLARLSQLEMDDPQIWEPARSFGAAAARLQLVAEPATALKANRLAFEYGKIHVSLIGHAAPIAKARIDLRIAKQWCEAYCEDAKRTLGEMQKLNQSRSANDTMFDALSSRYDFQSTQRDRQYDELNKKAAKINVYTLTFNKHLLTHLKEITPQYYDIFISLRRDLGMNADIDEFEEVIRQQVLELQAHYENVENSIQETFELSKAGIQQSD